VADGEISVETHGGQYEGGTGQCDDLSVEQKLTEHGTEDPRLVERHEQHLDISTNTRYLVLSIEYLLKSTEQTYI